MLPTIEAEIDVNGDVRLLEPITIKRKSRAIITILDSEAEKPGVANGSRGIREKFGTWEPGDAASDYPPGLDHNQRIDFDLARSYARDHEDED